MSDSMIELLENSKRELFRYWAISRAHMTPQEANNPDLVDVAFDIHKNQFEKEIEERMNDREYQRLKWMD